MPTRTDASGRAGEAAACAAKFENPDRLPDLAAGAEGDNLVARCQLDAFHGDTEGIGLERHREVVGDHRVPAGDGSASSYASRVASSAIVWSRAALEDSIRED